MEDATSQASVADSGHCFDNALETHLENGIALSTAPPDCGCFFAQEKDGKILIFESVSLNLKVTSRLMYSFDPPIDSYKCVLFPIGSHPHCVAFQSEDVTIIYSFLIKEVIAELHIKFSTLFTFCAQPNGCWASSVVDDYICLCDWANSPDKWLPACPCQGVHNCIVYPPFFFAFCKNGNKLWVTNAGPQLHEKNSASIAMSINVLEKTITIPNGCLKQFLGIWQPILAPAFHSNNNDDVICVSKANISGPIVSWSSVHPSTSNVVFCRVDIRDFWTLPKPIAISTTLLHWPYPPSKCVHDPKTSLHVHNGLTKFLLITTPESTEPKKEFHGQVAFYVDFQKVKIFKIKGPPITTLAMLDFGNTFAVFDDERCHKIIKIA